jgi:hypothetical protein
MNPCSTALPVWASQVVALIHTSNYFLQSGILPVVCKNPVNTEIEWLTEVMPVMMVLFLPFRLTGIPFALAGHDPGMPGAEQFSNLTVMTTLKESKEQLLQQLSKQVRLHIPGVTFPGSTKALSRLRQIYTLVSALPLSNHIFDWYRKSADKVRIDLIEDTVRIYRVEDQQIELVEFADGDICGLIYSALENKN